MGNGRTTGAAAMARLTGHQTASHLRKVLNVVCQGTCCSLVHVCCALVRRALVRSCMRWRRPSTLYFHVSFLFPSFSLILPFSFKICIFFTFLFVPPEFGRAGSVWPCVVITTTSFRLSDIFIRVRFLPSY